MTIKWTISKAQTQKWQSIASNSLGDKLAAVVLNGGIYTSTDYGVNWSNSNDAPSNAAWSSIASDSTGQYLAAVVNNGGIYTSTDYGVNWSNSNDAPSNASWTSITSDASGNKLAAVVYDIDTNNGYIYTSNDYGGNWTQQTGAGTNPWYAIASDSTGTYLAVCLYYGGIYTGSYNTTTGVWSWTQQTTVPDSSWQSITSDSTGKYLAACVFDGGIYTSADTGVTWIEQTSAPTNIFWSSITSNSLGDKLAAVVNNGGIYTGFDYSFISGNYYYLISGANTVSLVGYVSAPTGSVTIPSTVTNNSITYSVTSIDVSVFQDCTDITCVTIPDSVTSIGSYAFQGCSLLECVTFLSTLATPTIGTESFTGIATSNTAYVLDNTITTTSITTPTQIFTQILYLTSLTPTGVTAKQSATTTNVTLTWSAPSNQQFPITSYIVCIYNTQETSPSQTINTGNSSTTYITPLLTAYQTYYFTVTTVTTCVTGLQSSPTTPIILHPAALPATPNNFFYSPTIIRPNNGKTNKK